ncbi:MAG TPA: tetratricopeptide repeat protein, partial [Candidatus Polarisedimenticolia bacterium]|nr:tetratricopeptide repeat protein [Candidatus Polarisedimenticolia bacterium]
FADITPAEYQAGLEWIAHPPDRSPGSKEKPPVQNPAGLLIKILAATRSYQAAALDLLGRGPWEFVAVYFEGIDLVGHRFQHYRPPRMRTVSEAEYRKFGRTVTEYYRYQDRLIGELLQRAGGGVTVLVLSDHGFKTGGRRPEGILPYTMDQPVEWHREEGIFILSGPGANHGRLDQQATLFDITPTILALLGLPVASDMPGRVLASALDPDFLRRFPPARVPTYEGVGAAREPEGVTASDEVSAEMMAQLRALGYVGGDTHSAAPVDEKPERVPTRNAATEDTPVTYHRNLATYHLSHRNYEKAVSELLEANRREKLPKTYAMLAEAYDALGRREEAMAALEEGWKTVPQAMASDSILWFLELAVQAGHPDRGAKFLTAHRESLKDAPAVRDAAEARLAEAAGRREDAKRLYEQALAEDPTLVVATKQLLGLYRLEGRAEAIRPVLEAGLRRSERVDEYHNLLGGLDSEAGHKEKALGHFRRAAELNPGEGRFSLNVGLTLMDLGRWREAGSIFEEAVASSPSPDLYVGLGNVRLRSRDPAGALAAFEKARVLGNGNPRADLGIALSYLSLKRRDEALAFARESLSRDPANQPLQNLYQDLLRRR